jgi:hypothetical protein
MANKTRPTKRQKPSDSNVQTEESVEDEIEEEEEVSFADIVRTSSVFIGGLNPLQLVPSLLSLNMKRLIQPKPVVHSSLLRTDDKIDREAVSYHIKAIVFARMNPPKRIRCEGRANIRIQAAEHPGFYAEIGDALIPKRAFALKDDMFMCEDELISFGGRLAEAELVAAKVLETVETLNLPRLSVVKALTAFLRHGLGQLKDGECANFVATISNSRNDILRNPSAAKLGYTGYLLALLCNWILAVGSTADISSKILVLNGSDLNTVSSALGMLKLPTPIQLKGANVVRETNDKTAPGMVTKKLAEMEEGDRVVCYAHDIIPNIAHLQGLNHLNAAFVVCPRHIAEVSYFGTRGDVIQKPVITMSREDFNNLLRASNASTARRVAPEPPVPSQHETEGYEDDFSLV